MTPIPKRTQKGITKRVSGPDKISLFHVNCFWWAGVDTCFTIHTHVLVDLCLFVLHWYSSSRTLAHTCFASGTFFLVYNGDQTFHSTTIASEGQTSTHVWQSTHISLSTFAFSFSMAIAEAGHSFTHVSHPVHLLLSTIATNLVHSIVYVGEKIKNRFRCEHGEKNFRSALFKWKNDKYRAILCSSHPVRSGYYSEEQRRESGWRSRVLNQRIFINEIDKNRVGYERSLHQYSRFVINAAAPEGTPPRRIG